MQRNPPWLTAVLAVDAVSCLALGLAAVAAPGPIGALLGLAEGVIVAAGAVLLAAAALLVVTVSRRPVPRSLLRLVVIGNAGWVIASLAVLVLMPMTTAGLVIVGVQAIAVAVVTVLEARPLASVQAEGAA
jgi:hypothetical protein